MITVAEHARKPNRDELPKGANLCEYCTGKCCRYIALPIDTPTKWKDFDEMRWYLSHKDISIFVEDESWYLMVHRDCEHLLEDNRCGIYLDRPQICRDHTTDDCEYDDDFTYEKIFENDVQLWEYAEVVLGPKRVRERSWGVLPIGG
ncbi:Flagellin N-methylase [Planctomycetes bacterium Pan216]|uniref:Flagellin N-methylase n=1 Tax=Kolteria novifilia TaxID=2527975 RepID=A0A518BCX8_9BACT|nr:Flagellin N-methylase [Planctomycetes bacterium Pan216]